MLLQCIQNQRFNELAEEFLLLVLCIHNKRAKKREEIRNKQNNSIQCEIFIKVSFKSVHFSLCVSDDSINVHIQYLCIVEWDKQKYRKKRFSVLNCGCCCASESMRQFSLHSVCCWWLFSYCCSAKSKLSS